MNLMHAIESKKPFKRIRWGSWLEVIDDEFITRYPLDTQVALTLRPSDCLADDWEIKNETP